MPSDFIKVIETICAEKRPDIDIRSFTAVHNLLIAPHALLKEPFSLDVDFIRTIQTLIEPAVLPDEDVDALIANYFLSRNQGDFATGTARVFFTRAQTVTFRTTDLFAADNGTTFSPSAQTTVTESIMRLNQSGGLYFADVIVRAVAPGTSSRIGKGRLTTLQGASFSFVRVTNPFPFSGGAERETNEQLALRAQNAISVRDFVSERGARTKLQEKFSFIERIFIAGFLDPEQRRDLYQGVHIGGRADIWVKPASLLSDQVLITVPDSDGNFVISDAGSAPGNLKRPVVFIDSVRLLDGGGLPTGAALNREEQILIPFTALVASGRYEEPSVAYNSTLNHIHLVILEVDSTGKRFVNYARLSTQGVVQIAFTRISAGTADTAHPYIVVNPANNRAYLFWGEGGTLKAKVLDISGSTITIIKDTFDVVTGTATIGARIDAAVADDSHIHLVFSRTVAALDGTTQENPWYARLDANGNIPGLVVPRQLVFDLSGNNGFPSVVSHGTVGTLKVTVVFAQGLLTSSNLYALQLDNDGQFIGGSVPIPLTFGFADHDQPTIRKGPSDTIHIVYRFEKKSVAYQRVTKDNLVIFQPETIALERTEDLRELKLTVNSFGQLYPYWAEDSGDFADIFTVKIDGFGDRIGPIQDVTSTPYFSFNPNLVVDAAGDIHIVWLDGVRGTDKPFYNKRSAQEFHVVVADSALRYSGQEQLKIVPEIPAANGVGVDLQWSDLLEQIQVFVKDPNERTIVADILVKNQIPATATCAVKFGPATGSLSTAQAKALIENYLNAFEGGSLEVAALISLLIQNGATSVTPFEVTVKIDQIDGSIDTRVSGDTIEIPRGVFIIAKDVTAEFK